jgi:putative membrane protein insertion efficiency factor
MEGERTSPAAWVLLLPIRFYRRFLSPLMPPTCRFTPSCSTYAVQAQRRHGALRGSWLAVRRLARCHPFNPGGYDPVPPVRAAKGTAEPPDSFTGDGAQRDAAPHVAMRLRKES